MSVFTRRGQAPAQPAAPAAETTSRTIEPATYGYVAAADIDDKNVAAQPELDALARLAGAGDWPAIAGTLRGLERTDERRYAAIDKLGRLAAVDDGWLSAWLGAEPDNVDGLAVFAESLVHLAWEIRTANQADKVSADQWDAFFRVLKQVPPICRRATELAADDPAPHIVLLTAARGLQWKPDEYRALWAEVKKRAPHSATAVSRAVHYWKPRWYGSAELLAEFVDAEVGSAPPGSLLTPVRLDTLYFELCPDDEDERDAFRKGPRMAAAIDEAVADLAAADPTHPRLPYLRHWLAYLLQLHKRSSEAVVQFQAIGGYCGAPPWTIFANGKAVFTRSRATATLAWEDAGRPGPATVPHSIPAGA
jgi:hypothetical protein